MIPFSPGSVLSFAYPLDNRQRVSMRRRRRRLLLHVVRDIELDPLTIRLRPDLRRGRYLVTGLDLDKCEVRSFYLESASELCEVHQQLFRLALYDPVDGAGEEPAAFVGPVFTDSETDRRRMREILRRYRERSAQDPKVQHVLSVHSLTGPRRWPVSHP